MDAVLVCPTGLRLPPDAARADLRIVRTSESALIPEMWRAGIEAASGEIVALTTCHFEHDADFAVALRTAFADPGAAGVGGRIDPPRSGGSSEWAVYLLRYGRFLGQAARRAVDDFAADNGAYRTEVARERLRASERSGFWEHEFHREMRRDGLRLLYDPAIKVRQTAAFPAADFLRQRFRHGLLFGRERAAGLPFAARCFRALGAAFLLPWLLLVRASRGAIKEPNLLGGWMRSLPWLLLFASAWAAGEATGYVTHASRA